jgi:hypothetical protein
MPIKQLAPNGGFQLPQASAGGWQNKVAVPSGRGQAAGLSAQHGQAYGNKIESGQVVNRRCHHGTSEKNTRTHSDLRITSQPQAHIAWFAGLSQREI